MVKDELWIKTEELQAQISDNIEKFNIRYQLLYGHYAIEDYKIYPIRLVNVKNPLNELNYNMVIDNKYITEPKYELKVNLIELNIPDRPYEAFDITSVIPEHTGEIVITIRLDTWAIFRDESQKPNIKIYPKIEKRKGYSSLIQVYDVDSGGPEYEITELEVKVDTRDSKERVSEYDTQHIFTDLDYIKTWLSKQSTLIKNGTYGKLLVTDITYEFKQVMIKIHDILSMIDLKYDYDSREALESYTRIKSVDIFSHITYTIYQLPVIDIMMKLSKLGMISIDGLEDKVIKNKEHDLHELGEFKNKCDDMKLKLKSISDDPQIDTDFSVVQSYLDLNTSKIVLTYDLHYNININNTFVTLERIIMKIKIDKLNESNNFGDIRAQKALDEVIKPIDEYVAQKKYQFGTKVSTLRSLYNLIESINIT